MVGHHTQDLTRVEWRKSSYSDHRGGECVEAAPLVAQVGVRDSKSPCGPALMVTSQQWRPFLAHAKRQQTA